MRYIIRAKVLVLVLLQSYPAFGQTDFSPQFPTLWQEYLSLCGPIVDNPNQAFSTISPLAEGRISTWGIDADGSSVRGSISTNDFVRGASMHIHKSDNGFAIFCEAHIFTESPFDVLLTANSIRQLLTAGGVMTVAGGEVTDVGNASKSLAEMGQAPWVSLSVGGAYPTVPLITMVDLSP